MQPRRCHILSGIINFVLTKGLLTVKINLKKLELTPMILIDHLSWFAFSKKILEEQNCEKIANWR